MQALGLIEVKGLLAAIESADAMVKSANVNILEKVYVGGGLVSITITGDVGAVKSAIDAGVSSVERLGDGFLISKHVIARPHEELEKIIEITPKVKNEVQNKVEKDNKKIECLSIESIEDDRQNKEEIDEKDNFNKEILDRLVEEKGIEEAFEEVKHKKVFKLRELAKEYNDLEVTGGTISKLTKKDLLEKLKEYYNK